MMSCSSTFERGGCDACDGCAPRPPPFFGFVFGPWPASPLRRCRYTYDLSWCPSGVLARFSTDATSVTIKVDRHSIGDGMLSLTGRQDDIMSYNGRFGIDVYAEDEHNAGKWRWFQTSTSGSQRVRPLGRYFGSLHVDCEAFYCPSHAERRSAVLSRCPCTRTSGRLALAIRCHRLPPPFHMPCLVLYYWASMRMGG